MDPPEVLAAAPQFQTRTRRMRRCCSSVERKISGVVLVYVYVLVSLLWTSQLKMADTLEKQQGAHHDDVKQGTADEPMNICNRHDCRQADPKGSTWLGKHRGLGLMLHTKNKTTNMQQYNLAYLFVPKAGSSAMKSTLQNAGLTRQVWLSPTTGTSALDPLVFTMIRDPGERVVSAYSTLVSRYNGHFAGVTRLSLPNAPKNNTDAAWKKHFQQSIWKMMNSVKKNGWNNTNIHWNEHIIPQVEFMRGLNVSHIGCIGSINETLAKLNLLGTEKKVSSNQYEHNSEMPSVKFGSYDMLSLETKALIREVYDEDYALFDSLCTENG